MKWITLAPYGIEKCNGWFFSMNPDSGHDPVFVPAHYDHDRSRKKSGPREWLDYFIQSWSGIKAAKQHQNSGILTVFPQLAAVMAFFKAVGILGDRPILAWSFNIGRPYDGIKGVLARAVLSQVDLFVVYSRAEIEIYSKWLRLPKDRFIFVPLNGVIHDLGHEGIFPDKDHPYVLAMGTANRDYRTMLDAMTRLGLPTTIISGAHALDGLTIPKNVQVRSGLTYEECLRLARKATVNVIPIANSQAASGQVTLIDAMLQGLALVVTRCAGTVDYVEDRKHALLVPSGDVNAMTKAIQELWNDRELRTRLSENAKNHAAQNFTENAIKVHFPEILSQCQKRHSSAKH